MAYSLLTARRDLLAGITVAAISLPQAMAYALIAGVDPRFGLYSAIVVTFVASVFGSSSHLINGPTNAISLVVFSALAYFDPDARLDAYQATFLLAIMVGILQILVAVFRLGDLTRYISESVVIGFMAGAGSLVALTQIGNLLGLRDKGTGHQHVLERIWNTLTQGGPVNLRAAGIALGSIVLVVLLRALVRRYRLPQLDMLATLIIISAFAGFLSWSLPDGSGKTLIAIVGSVPASLPLPHIPEIHFAWIKDLGDSALAIAFLGLLEALAIAKSIAHHTGQKLDYNRQCAAEGLANLVGGFFQCLPGSGSLTRSAINYQAGASTRASGLYAATTVALVVLLFAPLARYVPKAVLAGLLVVIATRLVDWKRLSYALRASRYDAGLVLVTALSAVFVSVEFSILIGVCLSILLFLPRAARLKAKELIVAPEGVIRERLASDPAPSDLIISDLEGELFFGAAPELDALFAALWARVQENEVRYVILRVKRTRNPDMVCMERFEHFLREAQKAQVTVLICGIRPDFAVAIANLRFTSWFPAAQLLPEEDETFSATLRAVRLVYERLGRKVRVTAGDPVHADAREQDLYYLV